MLDRRSVLAAISTAATVGPFGSARAQSGAANAPDGADDIYQLDYPDIASLSASQPFGYKPATEAERARAAQIVAQTPKGPAPIDVAQSFVDRFYASEPKLISQWPKPDSWNPLVVKFFEAAKTNVSNDMVAWCAAFANWCLVWNGRAGSNSAASQSFLSPPFQATANPKRGDLAIFTCYDLISGKSLGLGHVTFYHSTLDDRYIQVVGGNQSLDGHSSIVSNQHYPIYERNVHRHVNGKYVPCKMRLNRYIRIA